MNRVGYYDHLQHFHSSEIWPGLWMGGRPPLPHLWWLAGQGYSLWVCCEAEYTPEWQSGAWPGPTLLHCPLRDTTDEVPPLIEVVSVAKTVADVVRAQRKVLVSCYAGLNRSGLVVAHALHELTGWSGQKIFDQIRTRRQTVDCFAPNHQPLNNPAFRAIVLNLKESK